MGIAENYFFKKKLSVSMLYCPFLAQDFSFFLSLGTQALIFF